MDFIKRALREIFIVLHLDLTKNLKYDRLTRYIIKHYLKTDFNCVDIGCHKGEVLDSMIKHAPKGHHFAFEPIPYLFENLEQKYSSLVKVYPFALSDSIGKSTFQLVKNSPSYSGIKKRKYAVANPDIEEISVELKTLDSIIPVDQNIQFIKIDVEGGEFGVLKGAKRVLTECKPLVLFECGIGASDYYGTKPEELYRYLVEDIGLNIYTLSQFISGADPLSVKAFVRCFDHSQEYYFVAFTQNLK